MRMSPLVQFTFIVLILIALYSLVGCSTVAGVGQDIKGAAEWTHDKMTQPTEPAKKDPAR